MRQCSGAAAPPLLSPCPMAEYPAPGRNLKRPGRFPQWVVFPERTLKTMDEHQLNDPAHTTAPGSDAAPETGTAEAAEESPQKSVLRRLWDSTGYLLVPLVSVFLLLGVIFSLAWVPTGSMEPTLPTKSYFLGWRLPYFFGDPTPARGDIVMFRSEELGELLVKRVIAWAATPSLLPTATYTSTAKHWRKRIFPSSISPIPPAQPKCSRCRRAAFSSWGTIAQVPMTAGPGSIPTFPWNRSVPALWWTLPFCRSVPGKASAS